LTKLEKCPSVEKVLVVKRTSSVIMKEGRDIWFTTFIGANFRQ
jgi:hypothetical protein